MSLFGPRRRSQAAEVTKETRLTDASSDDINRHLRDFLADGVLAQGAALLTPDGPPVRDDGVLHPVFTLVLGDTAFDAFPELHDVFALLDEPGADIEAVGARMHVTVGWTVLAAHGVDPLAKLKLDFTRPVSANVRILLKVEQCSAFLHEAAAGGLLGLTTYARLGRIRDSLDRRSFADGLAQIIPLQAGASPGLEKLIGVYGWPTG
ncbi:hypothetical protein [Actinosynnema sp. NPDC023587]|uniref:hypothetical protein n=1 Tax=Actinosynnema sp. NPDC023587 TaxID=3154695 RepID=UPI0033C5C0C7